MTQWIVEGTRIETFRSAQSVAQQYANRRQSPVPLLKDCGFYGWVVVKMVSPRQESCLTRPDMASHHETIHPARPEPSSPAPDWERSNRSYAR